MDILKKTKRIFCASFAFITLILLAYPQAIANTKKTYFVDNVKISQKGNTKSRQDLIIDGKRKALEIMFDRIVIPSDKHKLPPLERMNEAAFITEFQISNENNVNNSYSALLSVTFSEYALKDFLTQSGIGFLDIKPWNVLVIPVFKENNKVTLWFDDNPWFEAWANFHKNRSIVSYTIPIGDLDDISNLNSKDLLSLSSYNFDHFFKKYDVDDILVSVAEKKENQLSFYVDRFGVIDEREIINKQISFDAKKTPTSFFEKEIFSLAENIENYWKTNQTQPLQNFSQNITVSAPITSLADLQEIKSALSKIPLVDTFKVTSIAKKEAIIKLSLRSHSLDIHSSLKKALNRKKLDLVSNDDQWIIQKQQFVIENNTDSDTIFFENIEIPEKNNFNSNKQQLETEKNDKRFNQSPEFN